MADKPTGPVKPPTLDLKARKSETGAEAAPKAGAAQKAETTPRASAGDAAPKPAAAHPPAPEPGDTPRAQEAASAAKGSGTSASSGPGTRPAPALAVMPLAAAGLGGAALGVAAAYGLALAGLWPPATPSGLGDIETRIARIETALETNGAALAGLDERLGAVEAAPAPEPLALPENLLTMDDLADVTARIEALGLRIDAVAAGLPGEDADQLSAEIARLGAGLADLETRLDGSDGALESLSGELAAIAARLQDLENRAGEQAAIEALRAERDRFAALPAATAALEAAIAAGAPFAGELAALEALMPEMGVTSAVRAIAGTGVRPLRRIADDFRATIPALLAARPQAPGAGWLDTLLDQAQAAIALRPVDDTDETPQALVGRIEAALEAGEPARARDLILSLPEPMQAVAAPVKADLDANIAAQALLADIRALAPLPPEGGQ